MALVQHSWCPRKTMNTRRERHTGRVSGTRRAEVVTACSSGPGRDPSVFSDGVWPCHHLAFDFWASELGDGKFLPCGVQCLAEEALGDQWNMQPPTCQLRDQCSSLVTSTAHFYAQLQKYSVCVHGRVSLHIYSTGLQNTVRSVLSSQVKDSPTSAPISSLL